MAQILTTHLLEVFAVFSAFPLFSTTAGAETALAESPTCATEIAQTLQFSDVSETRLIFQLALSLGLGLLIGLQRESARSGFGGVRTFPLIAVFGTLGALASTRFGVWILPSGLLCVALIGIAERAFSLTRRWIRAAELNATRSNANASESALPLASSPTNSATKTGEIKEALENESSPRRDFGATTLVSALATYCVGAILANPAWTLVGLEAGAIVAILLQFKRKLHEISAALGENDLNAIMQFALVSFVVLPILPNQNFGPFGAFNPFEAWLTVALSVGMSLAGYIVYKFY
ncbi:MAG: MgtC/SapB family protein, partial [Thermoguttaceae bacterium]|nr:MgtC/SapB family protein [Thermoguttaceae bacterium]